MFPSCDLRYNRLTVGSLNLLGKIPLQRNFTAAIPKNAAFGRRNSGVSRYTTHMCDMAFPDMFIPILSVC